MARPMICDMNYRIGKKKTAYQNKMITIDYQTKPDGKRETIADQSSQAPTSAKRNLNSSQGIASKPSTFSRGSNKK